MDFAEISALAHADHPIACPIGDDMVDRLLARTLRGRRRVLDLGCGNGTWLVRALAAQPELHAIGVDLTDVGFETARAEAASNGVAGRLDLVCADATTYASPEPVDAVLSLGAAHAFGGWRATLDAARSHLDDGGVLLFGDGFWERPPDRATLDALEATAEEYTDVAGTVAQITAAGWVPLYGHVSTAEEWDDYEWSWTGALVRWAADHPAHPDAEQVRQIAEDHRRAWLEGYRGTLGFVTLLLRLDPS